jgi:uncharacterized protein HemY
MSEYKIKNRKAQIGETTTWIFATLIIVALLVVSIYLSSLMGTAKKVFVFGSESRKADIVMEKSLFAYFSGDAVQKRTIYQDLQKMTFHANLNAKLNEMRGVLR